MSHTRTAALAMVVVLSLTGCWITGRDDDEATAIRSIFESPIIIELKQDLFPGDRQLALKGRTEKIYPSLPYEIVHTWSRSGNKITIRFTGIDGTHAMFTAFDYARARIELGSLPSDTYSVSIYVKTILIEATLVVTDDYWELKGGNSQLTSIPRSRLWRIPDDTIWGHVGYSRESTLPVVTSYYDSLLVCGAHYSDWPPGDYCHYTVDVAGAVGPPHLEPGHFIGGRRYTDWYIRSYVGFSDRLRDIVKHFGETHGDSLSVFLYLPDGAYYASHLHEMYPE